MSGRSPDGRRRDDGDDGYDRMKDEYHTGYGAPYSERTRREVQDEIQNDKDNGWR